MLGFSKPFKAPGNKTERNEETMRTEARRTAPILAGILAAPALVGFHLHSHSLAKSSPMGPYKR